MGERLRLADVERVPTERLVELIAESFDNLVTVAVAEAVHGRFLPPRTGRLLRKAEWRLDWQDALLCAGGELQVATERMRYTGDPRLEVTEHRLGRVRQRAHEAAILVKKLRRNDFHNSRERKNGTNSQVTAQAWLRHVFPDEYTDLVQRERARRHLSDAAEPPAFSDVHDEIAYAVAHGRISAPRSPRVDALLAASDTTVRLAAAEDAKEQDERDMALRHPLMLKRWENALRELGATVAERARTETPHALGALPDDVYTLPEAEAVAVLNARRFLAAVQQRRIEYKRYIRQLTQALHERELESPYALAVSEARTEADRLLVEAHPSEYAFIRAELRPYEEHVGHLPLSLVSSPQRAEIKRRVLAALSDGTWMCPAP